MNRSCFLSRATRRTPPNPWDTRSPLSVGRVLDSTVFSLIDALPSTTSAEACASLFGGFLSTIASCDSSRACVSGLWLFAFPDRSPWIEDASEVSRFSCILFRGVPGVFDYAGSDERLANLRPPPILPSHRQNWVGTRIFRFRSSIPCPPVPLSTLRLPPHDDRRKTRGQDGFAFPFL